MLAMVLRWFICDIAMATDAGGNPMGSRGWGIIMKGRSNPEGHMIKSLFYATRAQDGGNFCKRLTADKLLIKSHDHPAVSLI